VTDTPRTRSELLTIFGDGQAPNSITPQDMRDLVVSSVPAGGRFLAQANIAIPVNLTVPDGIANGITLPLGDAPSLKDPGSLLNVSPISYYAQTFAPGEALILQPGSWAYEVQMIWDTNTAGDRIGLLTNSDIRIETPGQTLDTWLGDPEYAAWPELRISQVNASTMTDKGSYRY
jgi:hypothetical protein